MGKIVRYITEDGSAFILAADTTDIAARAEQIHHTSAVTTAVYDGRYAQGRGRQRDPAPERRWTGRLADRCVGQQGQSSGLCAKPGGGVAAER